MNQDEIPLHPVRRERLREARGFLQSANYTEGRVCEIYQVPSIAAMLRHEAERPVLESADEPAKALAEVFLVGRAIREPALRQHVPPEILSSFTECGLLQPYPAHPGSWCASVALYPVRGLYITSDRWIMPDGSEPPHRPDIVYPAIVQNTLDFLDSLPRTPCRRLLDLGTGSGIGALVAARSYAEQVWACDITERACAFARFNALFNDIENTVVSCGDLYAPVAGLRFDRIIAHPSYMPVLKSGGKGIYYDGGEEGEDLTRRIVQGLPQHLEPGGRLYCVCLGLDLKGAPFEERVRGWLKEQASAFDVFVLARQVIAPERFAVEAAVRDGGGLPLVRQWRRHLEQREVEQLVLNCLVVQRRTGDRPSFTVRRDRAMLSSPAETEWLLQWEAAKAEKPPNELLSGMKPAVSPFARLDVTYSWQGGTGTPVRFLLRTDYPFLAEARIQAWAANLLNLADGTRTAAELFQAAVEGGLLVPETPPSEFYDYLANLVGAGFLIIREAAPPRG